jgi:hypothetical protein
MGRLLGLWLVLMSTFASAAGVGAQDDIGETSVVARVIIETAPLRTGPGAGFRVARIAQRGDTFRVIERSTRGFWFRVELADGSLAWIDGNAVYNHEIGPPSRGQRMLRKVFAPPPLLGAHGEIAVVLGVLHGAGFMAVRPSWLLAEAFGFELDLGGSVGSAGRIFTAGGGALINAFPSWPIVPFFTVGGGAAFAAPNADTFVLESGQSSHLYAGGGLRFGFRQRLIVRVEGRSHMFFDANDLTAQEEISCGLSAFF